MNTQLLKILKAIKKELEYRNNMAPFPVYDTEYIEDVNKRIDNMSKSKIDYDNLPVAACKYCNNLHIEQDDVENDICMRCGAVNEIVVYENIFEFLKVKEEDET